MDGRNLLPVRPRAVRRLEAEILILRHQLPDCLGVTHRQAA
jgi:hypothetical protein